MYPLPDYTMEIKSLDIKSLEIKTFYVTHSHDERSAFLGMERSSTQRDSKLVPTRLVDGLYDDLYVAGRIALRQDGYRLSVDEEQTPVAILDADT